LINGRSAATALAAPRIQCINPHQPASTCINLHQPSASNHAQATHKPITPYPL
jgi:hypothetical protein